LSENHAGSFSGQVAVVTGAGRGIGRSCAELISGRGGKVILIDRDMDLASAAARETGGTAYEADVSDLASMESVSKRIEAEFGPVDLLVANAGIIQNVPSPPELLDIALHDAIYAVDQRGVFITCKVFGGRMAMRGRGAIVNIASVAGMRSVPLHAYGPAKAAVIHLTQTLAAEWGRSGVRVNCVSPGYVLTPILEAAIAAGLRDASVMEENSALGRMVSPVEIAKAVAFLLSSDASAITGINLPVENGWLVTGSWHTYGGLRKRQ
jgi:NAD(P)-dependent dehydrogenase (short-subunit alcohol dehydrogenase family)